MEEGGLNVHPLSFGESYFLLRTDSDHLPLNRNRIFAAQRSRSVVAIRPEWEAVGIAFLLLS